MTTSLKNFSKLIFSEPARTKSTHNISWTVVSSVRSISSLRKKMTFWRPLRRSRSPRWKSSTKTTWRPRRTSSFTIKWKKFWVAPVLHCWLSSISQGQRNVSRKLRSCIKFTMTLWKSTTGPLNMLLLSFSTLTTSTKAKSTLDHLKCMKSVKKFGDRTVLMKDMLMFLLIQPFVCIISDRSKPPFPKWRPP